MAGPGQPERLSESAKWRRMVNPPGLGGWGHGGLPASATNAQGGDRQLGRSLAPPILMGGFPAVARASPRAAPQACGVLADPVGLTR